jgi:hypothetical protein
MEESGQTIRDSQPDAPAAKPSSWLCDGDDRPVVEYIHANDQGAFRIKVGAVWYERFGQNVRGEWLYRRVK